MYFSRTKEYNKLDEKGLFKINRTGLKEEQ